VNVRALFHIRRGTQAAAHEEHLAALEQRVQHLETLIEGLQDSVHRDSVRWEKEIHELKRKTEPGELTRALSADARKRGI
jgi:hypothetical protein